MNECIPLLRGADEPMLTVTEVAGFLHVSPRAIQKNIRLGKYKGVVIDRKKRYNIPLSSLPTALQQQYIKKNGTSSIAAPSSQGSNFMIGGRGVTINSPAPVNQAVQGQGARLSIATPPGDAICKTERGELPSPVSATPDMIFEKDKIEALARTDLAHKWLTHRKLYGRHGKYLQLDRDFISSYNTGILFPSIFKILKEVSVSSLYRWNPYDWTLNVSKYNRQRKEPSLTHEEKLIFRDCLLNPNRLSIGEATRISKVVLVNRGIPSPSHPITFRRWAEWFKAKNSHFFTHMREGEKALKDKEIFSIQRDASLLEVGNVLVSDGHRLNFQIINPYTGKPCRPMLIGYLDWKSFNLAGFEIMVEENTQAIASALRNSIINLGKIPKVCYQDNGKAFRAKFFTESIDFEGSDIRGLFGKVGIMAVFARPYNAKAKPIERFFKELGKFERLLPSFTGASVDDKPAWTKMGEIFHKIHHNGYIPTIEETVEMIEIWIHQYLEVQLCPHVKGKTIGEVFNEGRGPGVNIDELDELMMATEIKTIRANGIRFLGADYYDDALFGLRESVFIKYSLSNLSFIKVYDREGRFLCSAKRTMAVHPMAAHLGSAKDVAEVRHLQNKQKRLQKAVIKAAKSYISNKQEDPPWIDIVPLTTRTIEALESIKPSLPEPEERSIPDYMLEPPMPAIQACSDEPDQGQLSGEVKEARPLFRSEREKYEWLCKNPQHQTEQDKTFIEEFTNTLAYRTGVDFFERQSELIAVKGCVD